MLCKVVSCADALCLGMKPRWSSSVSLSVCLINRNVLGTTASLKSSPWTEHGPGQVTLNTPSLPGTIIEMLLLFFFSTF